MPIKHIKITNVMAFQNHWRKNNGDFESAPLTNGDRIHDAFELGFSDGINVIIGENGTGKTTLLKMIYAATQWSLEQVDIRKASKFHNIFSANIADVDPLKNHSSKDAYCGFEVSDGDHTFSYSLTHKGMFNVCNWSDINIPSVFIPTTEMLSHSKGFLALNEKFRMPFDQTQVDIIVNASLPEARSLPDYMSAILDKLSAAIDGTVIQENDVFYVVKNDGQKIDFSLEAEGLRKLALIWKLIRNGLLENGTVLIWDEPEANLNPELFPLVAGILLELQKNGIQIFIATHSYNFAKYLELLRTEKETVLFHNLFKSNSNLPDELSDMLPGHEDNCSMICSKSEFSMEDLHPNHLMLADEKLLDMVYEEKVNGK